MKKILLIMLIVFMAACTSDKSNLNDDQGELPDSVNDNNSTLPDNTVTDEEVEQDIIAEEDIEEVDDSSEEVDEKTEPDEDVDENYYSETCDCYGKNYTVPEQFRETQGWCKDDADSDGIPNCIEVIDGEFTNSDTDSDPDYLDTDSDDDGISDTEEGYEDADKDGLNNYRDPDSDNDQVNDSVECPATPCVDSDGDTIADYLDGDSDNDGLTDKQEKDLGTDRLDKDTDNDGYDDLAEVTYGSDPLDDQDGIPEDEGMYYVVLPYEAPDDVLRTLNFKTDVEKADILILLDRSSSMSGEIDNLKSGINSEIVANISSSINDAGFGLATFDDWKALNGDSIFSLVQPITTSTTDIQTAVNGISNLSSCGWEPHHEALYQVADGSGYSGEFVFTKRTSSTNACDVDDTYYPSIPAADCSSSDGSIGGACFRKDAMPIIIMLSDEGFTNYPAEVFSWTIDYHDKADAIAALNDINAKFIGVDSWDAAMTWTPAPEDDFKEISTATGSVSATDGEPLQDKQ